MELSALKAAIKANKIPHYLIFTGDEWYAQKIYIEQIGKSTGLAVRYIDAFSDIFGAVQNRSFTSGNKIYVVMNDTDLITNEKLHGQIDSGLLGANILIHILTAVDKRTKFYKHYKDSIVEFAPLPDSTIKKHVSQVCPLSEHNLQRLVDICGHDYGKCLLEAGKIYSYYAAVSITEGGHDVSVDDAFNQLVSDGTIDIPPYDAVFDFVNAFLSRDVSRAFDLLAQSYAVGEATMVLLTVMYNNAKATLQLQTCKSPDVCKSTGLSAWEVKNVKHFVGRFTDSELIYIVRLLEELESGIKSGRVDEAFAVPYVLVRTM